MLTISALSKESIRFRKDVRSARNRVLCQLLQFGESAVPSSLIPLRREARSRAAGDRSPYGGWAGIHPRPVWAGRRRQGFSRSIPAHLTARARYEGTVHWTIVIDLNSRGEYEH